MLYDFLESDEEKEIDELLKKYAVSSYKESKFGNEVRKIKAN